jgi:hypothetical protein|tara:strand:+ start:480 stop:875 length:396 start_codon:yes stop_codon:yes gene_type:complete
MPQFDIFSFFSQLFWVFLGFSFLYFSFSFFLLPALSSILKVRKRLTPSTSAVISQNTLIFSEFSSWSINSVDHDHFSLISQKVNFCWSKLSNQASFLSFEHCLIDAQNDIKFYIFNVLFGAQRIVHFYELF